MVEQVQPIRPPGWRRKWAGLDLSPPGRGAGLMFGEVTPSSRATVWVPRSNQVRLLGSNQQPSHPLGRLLRGGWTPTHGPFRAYHGRAGTANSTPGPQMLGCLARSKPGPRRGAGLTLRDVTPGSRATAGVPRRNQVFLQGCNQQPSRHSEGCFGEAGPRCPALFELSVVKQVQPIRPPGWRCNWEGLHPSPGQKVGRG